MSRPPRLFFINRFYWPDEQATAQLLADLAEALAARGHAITVIASQPPDSDAAHANLRHGVVVERVRTTRWGRRHLLGRLFDFATFYVGAVARVFRLARPGDTIAVMTDPPLIGFAVWPVAALRGAALVHWVQDIYPEVVATVAGQRWLLALRPLRNLAWRRAAACVVPGADMAAVVTAAGVPAGRVKISANWAPAGVQPCASDARARLRAEWGVTDKFVLAYSGNLGRVHLMQPLVELAEALRDDPDFVFVFIGHGARRAELEAAARARGLTNLVFRPPQPRAQLSVSLSVGDVHFVTLLPGAERCVFPSKLYGITQVGRPVIFIGEPRSELAGLIAAGGFGRAFAPQETATLATYLRKLRTDPAAMAALGEAAQRFSADGLGHAENIWSEQAPASLPAPPTSPRAFPS